MLPHARRRRLAAGGAAALLLSLSLATRADAQQDSNLDFSVEDSIINQCTGEPTVISLEGRIVSRPRAAGSGYVHSIVSQLTGTAVGEISGTRYRFVGAENVELESETLAAELVLWANVRVITRGGENTYIGYDVQTISTGETGEVEHVEHQFDFACD